MTRTSLHTVLDEQVELHRVIGACRTVLIFGARESVWDAIGIPVIEFEGYLEPGLALAWPDHPTLDPDDCKRFLEEVTTRAWKELDARTGAEGFVPAALWDGFQRDLFLEHFRHEFDAVIGGYLAEGLWNAFLETSDTAPLSELVETGMLTKLRVLEGFYCCEPTRFDDELNAAEFFPAGEWIGSLDPKLVDRLVQQQRFINKQVSHLTATRPIPEDKLVYRDSTYLWRVETLLELLRKFTDTVDERLLPDWWYDWVTAAEARIPKPLH